MTALMAKEMVEYHLGTWSCETTACSKISVPAGEGPGLFSRRREERAVVKIWRDERRSATWSLFSLRSGVRRAENNKNGNSKEKQINDGYAYLK